jgi:hypothetical protein
VSQSEAPNLKERSDTLRLLWISYGKGAVGFKSWLVKSNKRVFCGKIDACILLIGDAV